MMSKNTTNAELVQDTPVPQDVSSISRLDAMLIAVDFAIDYFSVCDPECRFGLINFGNKVEVVGDGSKVSNFLSGSSLNNFEQVVDFGT